jgi:twinkle protein
MHNFQAHGIKIPAGAKGNIKTICPNCTPHNRKPQNRNSKDLSVNIEEGVWHCHNCNWSGGIPKEKQKKEYTKPEPRLQKVSDKVIQYFEGRGISNNTLLRFNITEAEEWMPQTQKKMKCICFNYYRGEELVNIKFRSAGKDFKLSANSELILYNLNALEGQSTAVIVEGEIDCLTMHEAGVFNAVSVPNGASKGNQKLEYLDNCWQYFEDKERIVICVDNDEAGNALKEELGRRLGKTKCYTAVYPDGCKDANEVLIKYGKDAVIGLVENAKEWPLEGIIHIDDMVDDVWDWFQNGYPSGDKAGIENFDEYVSFVPGQMTIITGIPGSGKDEFFNNIATGLAKNAGWTFGMAGFEEPAPFTVTKLMEKIVGKSFAFRKEQEHRMNQDEFLMAIELVNKHFHFVNLDMVGCTIDAILGKFEELVKKYGINGAVINPWNCIDHKIPKGYSETQYTSEVLTKMLNFAVRCNAHLFLVAHPTKIPKSKETGKYEIPTLYNISGSSHFFNKTYNGICVYRDFDTNQVDVYIQKVKWSWLGKLGYCSFSFNTDTRQYKPLNV